MLRRWSSQVQDGQLKKAGKKWNPCNWPNIWRNHKYQCNWEQWLFKTTPTGFPLWTHKGTWFTYVMASILDSLAARCGHVTGEAGKEGRSRGRLGEGQWGMEEGRDVLQHLEILLENQGTCFFFVYHIIGMWWLEFQFASTWWRSSFQKLHIIQKQ